MSARLIVCEVLNAIAESVVFEHILNIGVLDFSLNFAHMILCSYFLGSLSTCMLQIWAICSFSYFFAL